MDDAEEALCQAQARAHVCTSVYTHVCTHVCAYVSSHMYALITFAHSSEPRRVSCVPVRQHMRHYLSGNICVIICQATYESLSVRQRMCRYMLGNICVIIHVCVITGNSSSKAVCAGMTNMSHSWKRQQSMHASGSTHASTHIPEHTCLHTCPRSRIHTCPYPCLHMSTTFVVPPLSINTCFCAQAGDGSRCCKGADSSRACV